MMRPATRACRGRWPGWFGGPVVIASRYAPPGGWIQVWPTNRPEGRRAGSFQFSIAGLGQSRGEAACIAPGQSPRQPSTCRLYARVCRNETTRTGSRLRWLRPRGHWAFLRLLCLFAAIPPVRLIKASSVTGHQGRSSNCPDALRVSGKPCWAGVDLGGMARWGTSASVALAEHGFPLTKHRVILKTAPGRHQRFFRAASRKRL